MMFSSAFKGAALSGLILGAVAGQAAASEALKPFVLAATGGSDIASVAADAKAKLTAAGFEVVGEYSPYGGNHVLIATNDALKAAAASSERGGYGAVVRVGVAKKGDTIETTFTNPVYWGAAYRIDADLSGVKSALAGALGSELEFGSGDKELSAKDLKKYHYTVMMEYFDDPSELAEYDSHAEAVKAVEAALAAGKGATAKVYRVDVGKDPEGKEMTVFGVALKGQDGDDCSGDTFVMENIDREPHSHVAHLPYEMLVYGDEVEALYARFRIAIAWPHLPMMASDTGGTFMNIMCSPNAIEEALIQAAGEEL